MKITSDNSSNFSSSIVLFAAFMLTLTTLTWLLIYCHYGFDLTDESFYLNWISSPWIYKASVMQFGFIYHPLHLLFHGDIALLRQSNILIIYGLTLILIIVVFRSTLNVANSSFHWRTTTIIALAAVFATSSLIYFCPFGWLATPSYNSLILQAFILASIGVLLAEKTVTRASITGWILLGIGGWLAFMAKPPAAGTLGILVLAYLPLAGKFNLRLLLISVLTATALLIAFALTIDGSIFVFIERIKHGITDLRLLVDGQLLRLDNFILQPSEKVLMATLAISISTLTLLNTSQKKLSKRINNSVLLAVTIIGFMVIFNLIHLPINRHTFLELQILAIPLSALIVICMFKITSIVYNTSRHNWITALFFLLLPYASAIGTGNNYWLQSQLASVFWVIAGLIIIMPAISSKTGWQILLPAAIGSQLITIALLQSAIEFPYRQPQSLPRYNNNASIGVSRSNILLTKDWASDLINATKSAELNGFKSNTPMIDLTGLSAGLVYAIGGKPIGQPWMMGGYAGSAQFAIAALNRVNCNEIAEAWIILEPENTRHISSQILENFGINVDRDYRVVAELNVPAELTNNKRKPLLLKPNRLHQKANKSCENSKLKQLPLKQTTTIK